MRLVKGIVSNNSVQEFIVSNESIINDVINVVTPKLLVTDSMIVKENLNSFVTGDLVDTFETISAFAQEDMTTFIGAISDVLADTQLSVEAKIGIINFAIDDSTDHIEETTYADSIELLKRRTADIGQKVGQKVKDSGVVDTITKKAGEAKDWVADKATQGAGHVNKAMTGEYGKGVQAASIGTAGAVAGYGAYKGYKALKAKRAAKKAKR